LGGTNVGAPLSHFRSLVRDPLKTITHAAWACTDWCPELADELWAKVGDGMKG